MKNRKASALSNVNRTENYDYLIKNYEKIGKFAIKNKNIEIGCFYITQAYIFSLELGLKKANEFHRILKKHGREE